MGRMMTPDEVNAAKQFMDGLWREIMAYEETSLTFMYEIDNGTSRAGKDHAQRAYYAQREKLRKLVGLPQETTVPIYPGASGTYDKSDPEWPYEK
jgi:hypothetical protein